MVISASNIQCYAICLDRKWSERGAIVLPELRKLFPKAQPFNAVDADLINVNTDSRVSIYFKHHHKLDVECDPLHARHRGIIGCSLSHIALWQKCVDSKQPMLVVEDDIAHTLATHGTKILNNYRSIPNGTDFASILNLDAALRHSRCVDKWCSIDSRRDLLGTQMYYITPKAAQVLLDDAFPIVTDVDVYMSYVLSLHTLKTNPTEPSLHALIHKDKNYIDMHSSVINRVGDASIKKILPDNNGFYITIGVVFIVLIILCIILLILHIRHSFLAIAV